MFRYGSTLITLSLASLLTACGGSDGSSSQGATTGNTTRLADCIDTDLLKQQMQDEVNTARSEARTCGKYGDFPAASAITWDDVLRQAADGHSQDMAKVNFFSHTGSNGSTLGDRVKAVGYSYSLVGENLAAGQTSSKSAVDDWIGSEGHCKNLMTADFTEIGAACAYSDSADYKRYWTLVLGKPR